MEHPGRRLLRGRHFALNAHDIATPRGETFFADSFHHELSSVVRDQVLFNVSNWTATNPPGFAYASLDEYKRILAQRPPVEGDDVLHEKGFVPLYGTTSLDNDWNTYAERVFGHAQNFTEEISRFPKVLEKPVSFSIFIARWIRASKPCFLQTACARRQRLPLN